MTLTRNFQFRPFLMEPIFAERIWGKMDLKPWYEETGFNTAVGEAWLTAPGGKALTGELKGMSLSEAVPEFPLLVKMLFPGDKLSVQVHPDDEQARAMGLPRGKTECWYVLEALPGAQVACGLRSGVGMEDVRAAVLDGSLEDLLEMVPVSVGDMVFVDAGTVHAIGAGVTLLEVQQASDTTYRLYDYGRARELHLEDGLAVVKTETKAGKVAPKQHDEYLRLIETKYFVVDRFDLPGGTALEMPMDGLGCVVGLGGSGAVNEVRFGVGQAVVVPDSSVTMTTQHGLSFLRCYEPSE